MLAVVVINRVQAVNARFGYSVGDQMLAVTAQHFRKNLSARDRLYRWHGPAFIVLLDRAERIDHVRAEFRHFADTKLEKTVEIGSRTVLIPISTNWSIFPIAAPAETLMKRVETFTAAQVPKDYV
jgi:GGDEF domain-containing protein